MKITTIRALILVVDTALLGGLGWVVTLGFKARDAVKVERSAFEAGIKRRLEARSTKTPKVTNRKNYGDATSRMNLSNEQPKPVEQPKVEATPVQSAKPPLDTLLKIVGIQVGPGNPRSVVYLARESGSGGAPPAAARPEDAMKDVVFYIENQAVEWAQGAIVRKIEPTDVIFEYDGKEQKVEYKAPAAPAGAPAAPAGSAAAKGPPPVPNTDPKTWLEVNPQNPGTVTVTPVGGASIAKQGDDVLKDVRWSSETLPDGSKGVRIDFIPPGNVLQQGGAESGDVLKSVNGIPMSSRAEVVDYVTKNQNLAAYDVELYRKGVLYKRRVLPPRR